MQVIYLQLANYLQVINLPDTRSSWQGAKKFGDLIIDKW